MAVMKSHASEKAVRRKKAHSYAFIRRNSYPTPLSEKKHACGRLSVAPKSNDADCASRHPSLTSTESEGSASASFSASVVVAAAKPTSSSTPPPKSAVRAASHMPSCWYCAKSSCTRNHSSSPTFEGCRSVSKVHTVGSLTVGMVASIRSISRVPARETARSASARSAEAVALTERTWRAVLAIACERRSGERSGRGAVALAERMSLAMASRMWLLTASRNERPRRIGSDCHWKRSAIASSSHTSISRRAWVMRSVTAFSLLIVDTVVGSRRRAAYGEAKCSPVASVRAAAVAFCPEIASTRCDKSVNGEHAETSCGYGVPSSVVAYVFAHLSGARTMLFEIMLMHSPRGSSSSAARAIALAAVEPAGKRGGTP
mmetsp:Transcript_9097/g.20257  ORF Transcript_9097/g.20257 Transcript_9097/m.20257 type:complete len:374 (-) Transcript_9097:468-1589(-)